MQLYVEMASCSFNVSCHIAGGQPGQVLKLKCLWQKMFLVSRFVLRLGLHFHQFTLNWHKKSYVGEQVTFKVTYSNASSEESCDYVYLHHLKVSAGSPLCARSCCATT